MILNRSLSFNAAGGMLKPLTTITHKELEVLYHELFHAHMDYLAVRGEQPSEVGSMSNGLMGYAQKEQPCRHGEVSTTPVVSAEESGGNAMLGRNKVMGSVERRLGCVCRLGDLDSA
jgi:hypothetical protein